jgi:hypothetical protein
MIKKFLTFISLLSLVLPLIAVAQQQLITGVQTLPTGDVWEVISRVINVVFTIAIIVGIIAIIVGGIMFATAGGDAEKVTNARNMVLYAAIGIGVAALAWVIVQFVRTQVVSTT